MPNISDNQMQQLNTVTDSLGSIADKLNSGDTNLTPDEVGAFNRAYTTWRDSLDRMS